MSTAVYVDPKRVQALVDNANEKGVNVNVKDLNKLINCKNIGINPSSFQHLIDLFPEPSIPKNGDAIYHGGYPLYDTNGNYKTIKIVKNNTEIEKIETTEPCFTLRFRLLEDKVIIGWAVPRSDSFPPLRDIFSRPAGRNYSHLQLLRNCNDMYVKKVSVKIVNFMALKNHLPIPVFANLKFYIEKFVKYVNKDINTLEFYISTGERVICCFKGSNIVNLPNQYLHRRFYKKYTKI